LTPSFVKEPKLAFIHQLAREIWFYETSFPISVIGYLAEPRILRLYNSVPFITVSESSKESLVKIGIREESIHIVYGGIDHERFKPCLKNSDSFHIAYVGWFKKYKRVFDILQAMKSLSKDLPKARLWLASKSDSKSVSKVKHMIQKLNLENNVNFLGGISEEEKIKLLKEVQVLVYTSVREGFGLPILEAAACGTPCVAYDVPGLRDAIIDGKTGLLVPYGDTEALAKALITVVSNAQFRKELSQNGFEWSQNFSWEKTADNFFSVIKHVLSN